MPISVLVPSRGRPDNLKRLATAFLETCRDSTYLIPIIDLDDPYVDEYAQMVDDHDYQWMVTWVIEPHEPGIVIPLNEVSKRLDDPKLGLYPDVVGFMGDDHIPQTVGWDTIIQTELSQMKVGVVYGDDLLQGANLATAAFMTKNIVDTLGYMCPPQFKHLYIDNFWMDIGRGIGRLKYLPNVVIEHLHPLAKKSDWDPTYAAVNASPLAAHDKKEYMKYKAVANGLKTDIKKLRSLLE